MLAEVGIRLCNTDQPLFAKSIAPDAPVTSPGRLHPASRLQLPKLVHGKPRPATARITFYTLDELQPLGGAHQDHCQARQGHVCRNKQHAKNKATSSPYRPTTATNPRAIALRSRIESPALNDDGIENGANQFPRQQVRTRPTDSGHEDHAISALASLPGTTPRQGKDSLGRRQEDTQSGIRQPKS